MKSLFLILLLPASSWAYDWTCNLKCFNDGECDHGKGKFGSYAGLEEDEDMPWEQSAPHQNGMYCSCPVGYTGLQCEIKLVVCGEDGVDSHTCFNGSECKKERSGSGTIYYRCECDAAKSIMDNDYAGKYCEHIATTFCGKRKQDSAFEGTSSYCTNGGQCKKKDHEDQKHYGCNCAKGWEGSHCQTAIESWSAQDIMVTATSKKSVGKIVGIVCAVVFGSLLVVWCIERRKKKKVQNERRSRMSGMGSEGFSRRDGGEVI